MKKFLYKYCMFEPKEWREWFVFILCAFTPAGPLMISIWAYKQFDQM